MELPGGLVLRIPGFHCCGLVSIPGLGTEIPEAAWLGKRTTTKTPTQFALPVPPFPYLQNKNDNVSITQDCDEG